MSRKIAFIGLGIMGKPMAINLVKAGHHVTGFNLEQSAIDALVAEGGHGATSIADAVKDAEVVITMVPADPHVEQVILGEGGVLENVAAGTLVIDMSSITPQTSIKVDAAAKAKGVRTLDAPVSVARPAPSRRCCRSWSAAAPTTSPRPSRCSTCWAPRSSTSARPARGRPSRRPTS